MLQLKDIEKSYPLGSSYIKILKKINLEVKGGDYLSILGPSGSGKSTLLHIMGCLDSPTAGEYLFESKNVASLSDRELSKIRGRKIGFVFQAYNLVSHFNVLENVLLPLEYQDRDKKAHIEMAKSWIEKVSMTHRLKHRANQLSGGEKQRVAIARSFVTNPQLILADEPTGNLDSKSENEILDLFNSLHDEYKTTIIIITHNEKIAKATKRNIHILDGEIVRMDISER